MCYAEVPGCPAPVPKPTISPKPTRMPVPTFPIGLHDKQILGESSEFHFSSVSPALAR